MGGIDRPDALPLAAIGLAPGQVAAGAHKANKHLGVMAGMQDHETHAVEHPLLHPVDDGVVDLGVRHMAPPGQDVGRIEDRLAQAMLRLVQCGGRGFVAAFAQTGGEAGVDAVGIDLRHRRMQPFMAELVPNGDFACLAQVCLRRARRLRLTRSVRLIYSAAVRIPRASRRRGITSVATSRM